MPRTGQETCWLDYDVDLFAENLLCAQPQSAARKGGRRERHEQPSSYHWWLPILLEIGYVGRCRVSNLCIQGVEEFCKLYEENFKHANENERVSLSWSKVQSVKPPTEWVWRWKPPNLHQWTLKPKTPKSHPQQVSPWTMKCLLNEDPGSGQWQLCWHRYQNGQACCFYEFWDMTTSIELVVAGRNETIMSV